MHPNRLQPVLAGLICCVLLLSLSVSPVYAQDSQEQRIARIIAGLETNPEPAVIQLQSFDAVSLRASASAVSAVPMLAELVKSSRLTSERRAAATLLGKIGPAAASAVPALVEALQDNGGCDVRSDAAEALGSIGPLAASAVPALIKALNDLNVYYEIRTAAAQALGKIGPAAAVVPALVGVLTNGDGTADADQVRYFAAQALGNIGPSAASAAPVLVAALRDKGSSGSAVGSAAGALMKMGASAAYVLPDLTKVLRDSLLQRWTGDSWSSPEPDRVARSSAAKVIVNMGLVAPAVSALAESLAKSANPGSAKALAELSRAIHKDTAGMKDDALSATVKDLENTQKALETELPGKPVNSKQIRSGAASVRSMLAALKNEQARRHPVGIPK